MLTHTAERFVGDILLRGCPIELLNGRLIIVFLQCSKPGTAVVLGASSALLVSEMLASIGREKTYDQLEECFHNLAERQTIIPTCSAFSQLRFILD